MTSSHAQPEESSIQRFSLLEAFLIVAWFVLTCAFYVNLSSEISNPDNYRYFPPFMPNVNRNLNDHLGKEYFDIAQSLRSGKGYADPFGDETGPTAWMPPGLSALLAGLLWLFEGDKDSVVLAVIFLQALTIVATGVLTAALARGGGCRTSLPLVLGVFLASILCNFWLSFQFTHDCWLVLLAVDGTVAGLCWARPLASWRRAVAWGVVGGLTALCTPVVALPWAVLSAVTSIRARAWRNLALAAVVSIGCVCPWVIRNHHVLGRWIPVKSNLPFELYQSQCLQPDGILQPNSFPLHPSNSTSPEGKEYRQLGEVGYLDRKAKQFAEAVRQDPLDFARRVGQRFLAATLLYIPFDRQREPADRPLVVWLNRVLFPLPFLAALFLLASCRHYPLTRLQGVVLGCYGLYLAPYVLTSYYERYAFGLLGIKAVLVVWAWVRLNQFGVIHNSAQALPARVAEPGDVSATPEPAGFWSHRSLVAWALLAALICWRGGVFTRFLDPICAAPTVYLWFRLSLVTGSRFSSGGEAQICTSHPPTALASSIRSLCCPAR